MTLTEFNNNAMVKEDNPVPIKIMDYDTGLPVDSDNPLPTTSQLKIENVINDTAYDINAAPYSEVVTPSYDYILDNVGLEFSSAESRTITISSDNGTKIYESVGNTSLSVAVSSINFGQTNGQSFTIIITQTSGACTVDVSANIKNSPVALTADPVIASGTNTIGNVGLVANDLDVGVDASTNVLMNIDYSHHEVHSGSSFAIHVADANLAKDGEINIAFTTPAGDKWFHCEAMVGATNAGLFSIEEVAVTSGGTAYVPHNRNRNSVKVSTATTPVVNATYTSSTTQLHIEAVGAGKGGTAGGSRGTDEYILLAGTRYCFRYVGADTATSNGPASIEVTWYEHTDKN